MSDFPRPQIEAYLQDVSSSDVKGLKLAEYCRACLHEIDRLHKIAADCYRISGADPDGNEDWRLSDDAVRAVSDLRHDYDDSGKYWEAEKARADALDAQVRALRATLEQYGHDNPA